MPNLRTFTPLLFTTTMLLIALTSCRDEDKRTEPTKTDDKPGQRIDEKAERLDLKADQERDRDQDAERVDTMGTKTDTKKMDEIDIEDEFDRIP